MKNTKNFISLTITFLFFIITPIFAEPNPIEEIMPLDYNSKNTNAIVNITFDTKITHENLEISNYKIHIKNLKNETAQSTISLNWKIIPQYVNATINGVPQKITKESEYYNNVRYKIQTNILPENEKTIELSYAVLKIPNQWNLGLWALDYNHNTPFNIYFEDKTNDYFNTKTTYSGNIAFDYTPYKPSCNNCIYENNNVIITDANYFYVNWQKQRTPIRALSVYLIMVFAIIYILIKKRNVD